MHGAGGPSQHTAALWLSDGGACLGGGFVLPRTSPCVRCWICWRMTTRPSAHADNSCRDRWAKLTIVLLLDDGQAHREAPRHAVAWAVRPTTAGLSKRQGSSSSSKDRLSTRSGPQQEVVGEERGPTESQGKDGRRRRWQRGGGRCFSGRFLDLLWEVRGSTDDGGALGVGTATAQHTRPPMRVGTPRPGLGHAESAGDWAGGAAGRLEAVRYRDSGHGAAVGCAGTAQEARG